MTRHVSYDNEGNMYLEDIPGMGIEDKDLTEEEIAEKYDLVKPENTKDPEYEDWWEQESEESVEDNPTTDEVWVEEYQAKDLDDIFEYLEAKKKLVGGMNKIVIEKSMYKLYEADKYDFRWC